MSPLLFGVYMDGLLEQLKDLGIGCYIEQHFCGAAGYADDIILLCPTSYCMNIIFLNSFIRSFICRIAVFIYGKKLT